MDDYMYLSEEDTGDDDWYTSAVNEETFGDGGLEYNWEDQQEMFMDKNFEPVNLSAKQESVMDGQDKQQKSGKTASFEDELMKIVQGEDSVWKPSSVERSHLTTTYANATIQIPPRTKYSSSSLNSEIIRININPGRESMPPVANKDYAPIKFAQSRIPTQNVTVAPLRMNTLEEIERELFSSQSSTPNKCQIISAKHLDSRIHFKSTTGYPNNGYCRRHPDSSSNVNPTDPGSNRTVATSINAGHHVKLYPRKAPSAYVNDSLLTGRDVYYMLKVQKLQMQTDHPVSTDYYFLTDIAKKTAKAGGRVHPILFKLYPPKNQSSGPGSTYEPTKFENCLGKLQSISTLLRRRNNDITIVHVPEPDSPVVKKQSYLRRYLLLEIEQLYQCMLVLEEARIRTGLLQNVPDDELCELMDRRVTAAGRLALMLADSDKLVKILTVSKGRMLACRALPFIDANLKFLLLANFLSVIDTWGEDEEIEKVGLPYLRQCIFDATEVEQLLMVVGVSIRNNCAMLSKLVESKIGITLLLCIYSQAEAILGCKFDPRIHWQAYHGWMREARFGFEVIGRKLYRIPKPVEFYPNVITHLRRFPLNLMEYRRIETLFRSWSLPGLLME